MVDRASAIFCDFPSFFRGGDCLGGVVDRTCMIFYDFPSFLRGGEIGPGVLLRWCGRQDLIDFL